MNMNIGQIKDIFTYHCSDERQTEIYNRLRSEALQLALTINELCPDSREKSLAITNLQMAIMMANASVAIHG